MPRNKLIAGNWKMYKTPKESIVLARDILLELGNIRLDNTDVLICPSFTSLNDVSKLISKSDAKLSLGAQNMHYEDEGAFTGEISPKMLKELRCSYVILGHSERRHIFNEDDELINKKVKKALSSGLKPILCIGETKEQREKGKTLDINKTQLIGSLKDITKKDMANVIIAYEPVWAIGTGLTASPKQAQEVHSFIRTEIHDLFGKDVAENILILYGGSVKPDNTKELLSQNDIDGALIGGASLKSDDFISIIQKSMK